MTIVTVIYSVNWCFTIHLHNTYIVVYYSALLTNVLTASGQSLKNEALGYKIMKEKNDFYTPFCYTLYFDSSIPEVSDRAVLYKLVYFYLVFK